MIRIIAGRFGSRKLKTPDDERTRPMSDRVRESLFSALGERIRGDVLDLFAGSGALGIEAISRGAHSATFVDSSRSAIEVINQNCASLDVASVCTVIQSDVLRFVSRVSQQQFNLVFVAPPYVFSETSEVLRLLIEGKWLVPESTVVVERPTGDVAPKLPEGWEITWERAYGGTLVWMIQETS